MKKNIKNSQVKIICNKCNKTFYVYPYRIKQAKFCSRKCKKIIEKKKCEICQKEFIPAWPGKAKYCSQKCYGLSEKGRKPWNLGIKAIEDERIKHFTDAGHKAREGKGAWNRGLSWGNSVWLRKNDPNRYRNIHKKVYKLWGSPNICEKCVKVGNNRQIHWANINGKYLLKKEDWIRLCVKCHIAFDKSNKTRKEIMNET